MRYLVLAAALYLAACHGNDPATGATGSASPSPQTTPSAVKPPAPEGSGSAVADTKPDVKPDTKPEPPSAPKDSVPDGHDFTQTARELFVIGACGDGAVPAGYSEAMVKKHCEPIKVAQAKYADKWVKLARAFFAEKVPANVPKKVVYPFAGGDLSTALTVYPDADEITTMSLEPAGDPRTLAALNRQPDLGKMISKSSVAKPTGPRAPAELVRALNTVESELGFLYRVNFSNTKNLIDAMRGGALPTQLIFGLSALKVHGYEVVSLRYFTLDESGGIHYLTDDEVAKAPEPTSGQNEKRNNIFANAELRFKKPGGRVQIYRHIRQDLGDKALAKNPRIMKHLEAKGRISGMTKAASYLLSWESFSTMRDYLTSHVDWMVSDATGVAPKWGKAAGFEYETYGSFLGPHLDAGNEIGKDWRDEFAAQPQRPLNFRFGYPDKRVRWGVDHLIIMKKKKA